MGRGPELAALNAALDAGERLAAVSGAPGIGKSRLLAAVGAEAAASGALVLRGRAAEFEQDLPFAVWIDALDDRVAALPAEQLEALGPEARRELASVLPALAGYGGDGPAPLLDERHRVHAAMRELLAALAGEGRLLVVLDDLHWGDPGSIDLVASLLRRPPAGVALLLALRPGQAADRLAAAVDRAERDAGLYRLVLGPLDPAACDELLGEEVAAATRAELREESGGNPFYLLQLARALDAGGGIPRGVSDAIGEELRALPAGARRVLEGAAVVGDPFDPGLAGAAAQASAAETAAALDELGRRELVRPAGEGAELALRHPLVRRAVYESTGTGWRRDAHGRVAAALRERGARPALLAHHVVRSAAAGDAAAVALLREAAATELDRAPAAAAEWLAAARSLQDGGAASEAERLDLLEPLGAALAAAGSVEQAHEALAEAVALAPASDLPRRVALVSTCAALENRLGRHDEAERRLRGALAAVPADRPSERMPLLVELAANGFYRGDLEAMERRAREAQEDADTAGDAAHALAATAALALAAVMADRIADATRHWEDADARLAALPDEELARRLDAIHFLTLAGMYLERFPAMNEHAVRGIRVARETRQGALLPVFNLAHGYGAGMLGELAEARRVLDAATEAARIDGSPFSIAWVLMNAAMIGLFAGDVDGTIAAADEAMELSKDFDDNIATVQLGLVRADARAELGNWDRAHEDLLQAGAGPEMETIAGFWRCYVFDLLARIELGRGDAEAAAVAADRAEVHAAGLGLPLAGAWAQRARARCALAADDFDAATELSLAAAAGLEAGAAPVEAARARILAGRGLAGAGDRDGAVAELERAVAELDRCGAEGYRAAAARELRRLGRRPARGVAGAAGIESLSGREREVADLVAGGSTNAEIAAALYLSPKTVETHMRNIFAKLRVSSRLEVARLVDRDGDAAA